jgi:hypothetical protein
MSFKKLVILVCKLFVFDIVSSRWVFKPFKFWDIDIFKYSKAPKWLMRSSLLACVSSLVSCQEWYILCFFSIMLTFNECIKFIIQSRGINLRFLHWFIHITESLKNVYQTGQFLDKIFIVKKFI